MKDQRKKMFSVLDSMRNDSGGCLNFAEHKGKYEGKRRKFSRKGNFVVDT